MAYSKEDVAGSQSVLTSSDSDLMSRLLESSYKASEKVIAEETTNRIVSGQNPLDVVSGLKSVLQKKMEEQTAKLEQPEDAKQTLARLTELANTQVKVKKPGMVQGIWDLSHGTNSAILGPDQAPLGYDMASKVLAMEQAGKKDAFDALTSIMNAQKGIIDLQDAPIDSETKRVALEKARLGLKEDSAKYYALTGQADKYKEITGVDIPEGTIKRDIMGNLTAEGIKQTADAEGKISDVKKLMDAQTTFEGKLIAAVSSYEKLAVKGKTGPASGLIAKIGANLGSGDVDKANLESAVESLVWAGAAQIAGQSGRGVSDQDYERVKKMVNFDQMSKEKTVEGKVQFMMNELNNKVMGGGMKIKSAKNLINYVRARNAGAVGKNQKGEYVDAKGNIVKVKAVK